MAVLRRSLWPGLLGAARHNLAHQRDRAKLFEIGAQFTATADGVIETPVVAGLAIGPRTNEHWSGAVPDADYFDVKGDVEALLALTSRAAEFSFAAATHPALAPGRTARIESARGAVGWLGVLHPDLQRRLDLKRAPTLFALQMDQAFAATVPAFRSYSKFPSIRRDLAVVVDEEVTADALVAAARAAGGARLRYVAIFDLYRGPGVDSGRKSVGLGLILQDVSRTLTDADADQTVQSITVHLARELGATIRT
jgi:phenylalanyl-tRNA synthetase beta chain